MALIHRFNELRVVYVFDWRVGSTRLANPHRALGGKIKNQIHPKKMLEYTKLKVRAAAAHHALKLLLPHPRGTNLCSSAARTSREQKQYGASSRGKKGAAFPCNGNAYAELVRLADRFLSVLAREALALWYGLVFTRLAGFRIKIQTKCRRCRRLQTASLMTSASGMDRFGKPEIF